MFDKKAWRKEYYRKNKEVLNEKRRLYRKEHPEVLKKENAKYALRIRKWFEDNAEHKKEYDKKRRSALRFGGNYYAVLERDGYRCVFCGTKDKLVVHHIDGNGRGRKNPNNDMQNLVTVCASCHPKQHIHWTKRSH